jgi:hypothetical protein
MSCDIRFELHERGQVHFEDIERETHKSRVFDSTLFRPFGHLTWMRRTSCTLTT